MNIKNYQQKCGLSEAWEVKNIIDRTNHSHNILILYNPIDHRETEFRIEIDCEGNKTSINLNRCEIFAIREILNSQRFSSLENAIKNLH